MCCRPHIVSFSLANEGVRRGECPLEASTFRRSFLTCSSLFLEPNHRAIFNLNPPFQPKTPVLRSFRPKRSCSRRKKADTWKKTLQGHSPISNLPVIIEKPRSQRSGQTKQLVARRDPDRASLLCSPSEDVRDSCGPPQMWS